MNSMSFDIFHITRKKCLFETSLPHASFYSNLYFAVVYGKKKGFDKTNVIQGQGQGQGQGKEFNMMENSRQSIRYYSIVCDEI